MQHYFLISSGAFDEDSLSGITKAAESYCRKAGWAHTILYSGFSGEEEEIARHIVSGNDGGQLRLIVCGTLENLHFALNGIFNVPGIELGFIPNEPGSGFYDGILPLRDETRPNPNSNRANISKASMFRTEVESLLSGIVRDVDLLKINDRYCISGAALSFDARIDSLRRHMLGWKKLFTATHLSETIYLKVFRLVLRLFRASTKSVRIRLNGYERIEDQIIYALFANMPKCAEGYPLINAARPDDGVFDMLSAKRIQLNAPDTHGSSANTNTVGVANLKDKNSNSTETSGAKSIYTSNSETYQSESSNRPDSESEVKYRRCIMAEVDLPEPAYISMDGVSYLQDSRFVIATRPAALKMLVPENRKLKD